METSWCSFFIRTHLTSPSFSSQHFSLFFPTSLFLFSCFFSVYASHYLDHYLPSSLPSQAIRFPWLALHSDGVAFRTVSYQHRSPPSRCLWSGGGRLPAQPAASHIHVQCAAAAVPCLSNRDSVSQSHSLQLNSDKLLDVLKLVPSLFSQVGPDRLPTPFYRLGDGLLQALVVSLWGKHVLIPATHFSE